jgi:hypothetical protein
VKLTLQSAWLSLCLLALPWHVFAQSQTPTEPSAPTVPPASSAQSTDTTSSSPSALRPPKYTPNYTNTGSGLSLEPIYWLPSGHPMLNTGDYNNTGTPGNYAFPGKPDRSIGGSVIVPAGKGGAVRVSYFQTKVTGGSTTSQNLNLFGVAVPGGDPVGSLAKITDFKVSYDFVTYYWNKKGGDIRLKTLYEVQYVSIDSTIDDFQLQTDGTYNINPTGATKSIIAPTFGLGLDQTVSKHFRWEVRGSGWGLPHRSIIGDAEGDIALRYGRVELVAGARMFYFRTTRRSDQFLEGTLSGPFVGLRLYWKKK